jgi:ribosome-binding protein aMBF1 (putative translation factor)
VDKNSELWVECDGCGKGLTRRDAKRFAGSDMILCAKCARKLGFTDDDGYAIPAHIRDAAARR